MGGSSSQSSDTSLTIRFASYIEDKYSSLLDTVAIYRGTIIGSSPYVDYSYQNVEDAFFSAGYSISNFTALYDMFGKFMSGYDLEVLWSVTFADQMSVNEISDNTSAEVNLIDDALVTDNIPAFMLRMRDTNAVVSSSFVIGKANIECLRTKTLSEISTEAKFKLIPTVTSRSNAVLNWQKGVIDSYSQLMKDYYLTIQTGRDADSTISTSNSLWPFHVLDFERASLGTMRKGAGYQKTALERKRSTISKMFLVSSYMVTGAYIGYTVGNVVGAVIGAAVGFTIGVAQILFE